MNKNGLRVYTKKQIFSNCFSDFMKRSVTGILLLDTLLHDVLGYSVNCSMQSSYISFSHTIISWFVQSLVLRRTSECVIPNGRENQ